MTHDQIDRMVRRANPLPDPNVLTPVDAPVLMTERRMEMQTDDRVMAEGGGKRRSRGPLVGVAVAVAVLIAGSIFLLTSDDPPVVTPAPNARPLDATELDEALAPGAYWANTDAGEASSIRGTFVIEGSGWTSIAAQGARKSFAEDYVSLIVVEVDEVYESVCEMSGRGPVAAGATAADLGNQFANNGFIVREALAPVHAFGYDGHRLVMEVPPGCSDDLDQAWNGGIFQGRYYQGADQMLEYWFLDVEGTPVMVEATWFPSSPAEDVTELRTVLDTLVITP
jgi:hypothetical protein